MHVVQVSCAYDADLGSPEALLARYETLGAWSEALLAAGARRATIVQRFDRDADLERKGVVYRLRRDGSRPFPRAWASLGRLARAVAEAAPDLVHVNGLLFPSAVLGLRAALPASARIVVQDHGSADPPRDPVRRALARRGLAGADAFLFTAVEQADAWRAAGIVAARQRVLAVPEASRAVSPPPRPQSRGTAGVRGDPAIVWVGHLDRNKDPLTVVDGFARAVGEMPNAVLTLVFRGDALRGAVEARLAAHPALAGRVVLRGAVPAADMAAVLGAADLFVLGSRKEGSGYALLEAMACGAVPVVTDIPAHRALLGGGTLGLGPTAPRLLWPVGDAEAFARTLVDVARQPLAPLRAAVRAFFERELSWPAVGRGALAAYRAVLDLSPAASASPPRLE
jgi:glycosyltransferase involved in cell wall biosynthesis